MIGVDGAPDKVKKKPDLVKEPEAVPEVTSPSEVKATSAEPGTNSIGESVMLAKQWEKS